MDHGAFDNLTRAMAGEAGPRRAVVRLLTGGALSGVLARFGLDEDTEARAKKKHGRRHGDKKRSDHLTAAGKKHKKHKKHKDKDKPKKPKDPDPEPECSLDKFPCPDGTCVPWGSCCAGEKRCQEAKKCVPATSCCPGQKPCADLGCIPETECCELGLPLCGDCEEPFCKENGDWECRTAEGHKQCANGFCISTEEECCPEDLLPVCNPPDLWDTVCCHGERVCRGKHTHPSCWAYHPLGQYLHWNPETCDCECPEGYLRDYGIACCPTSHPYEHGGNCYSVSGGAVCALGYSRHDPENPNACVFDLPN